MAWDATAYGDNGDVEYLSYARKKSLFEMCQAKYGHCLGKIVDNAGESIGWRFAKCGSGKECIPAVYEIIIKET